MCAAASLFGRRAMGDVAFTVAASVAVLFLAQEPTGVLGNPEGGGSAAGRGLVLLAVSLVPTILAVHRDRPVARARSASVPWRSS